MTQQDFVEAAMANQGILLIPLPVCDSEGIVLRLKEIQHNMERPIIEEKAPETELGRENGQGLGGGVC